MEKFEPGGAGDEDRPRLKATSIFRFIATSLGFQQHVMDWLCDSDQATIYACHLDDFVRDDDFRSPYELSMMCYGRVCPNRRETAWPHV